MQQQVSVAQEAIKQAADQKAKETEGELEMRVMAKVNERLEGVDRKLNEVQSMKDQLGVVGQGLESANTSISQVQASLGGIEGMVEQKVSVAAQHIESSFSTKFEDLWR